MWLGTQPFPPVTIVAKSYFPAFSVRSFDAYYTPKLSNFVVIYDVVGHGLEQDTEVLYYAQDLYAAAGTRAIPRCAQNDMWEEGILVQKRLWGGRFSTAPDEVAAQYTASILFDNRMVREDIRGSVAHVRMLGKQGIIAPEEAAEIERGLWLIWDEVDAGTFDFSVQDEDIHTAVENRLRALDRTGAGQAAYRPQPQRSSGHRHPLLDQRRADRDRRSGHRSDRRAIRGGRKPMPRQSCPGIPTPNARSRWCSVTICMRISRCCSAISTGSRRAYRRTDRLGPRLGCHGRHDLPDRPGIRRQ